MISKEYYTLGISMNPQYDDFVKYAKSRISYLATAFNNVVTGKEECVAHHKDWMDNETEEALHLAETFKEYDGFYAGCCFLHLFEDYVVNHNEIPNAEKKMIFNAIFQIAFCGAFEKARITEGIFLEHNMSFAAYVMYRDLENLVLHTFYNTWTERAEVYSYLKPSND